MRACLAVVLALLPAVAWGQADPAPVPPPLPDLVVRTNLMAPATVTIGTAYRIRFTVQNLGPGSSDMTTDVQLLASPLSSPRAMISVPPLQSGGEFFADLIWDTSNGAPGDYTLALQVDASQQVFESDEGNNFATVGPVTLTGGGLTITPRRLPDAIVGQPYRAVLRAPPAGNPVFEVVAGGLPPGFSLERAGGVGGVPLLEGEFCFVVRASAPDFMPVESEVCLVVHEDLPPLAIVATPLAPACVGREYRHTFAATGGQPPYSWRLGSDPPEGLRLDSPGALFGRPSRVGVTEFAVQAFDTGGSEAESVFRLEVADCRALQLNLPERVQLVVGEQARIPLVAEGGTPPYKFVLIGRLPDGLRFDGQVIDGVPTAVQVEQITVFAEDTAGSNARGEMQIQIVRSGGVDAGVSTDSGADRTERGPGLRIVEGRGCACDASDRPSQSSTTDAIFGLLVVICMRRRFSRRALRTPEQRS